MSEITSAAKNVSDQASSASKQLVDSTRQAIGTAAEQAKDAFHQASGYAADAKEYAQGQCENAADAVSTGLKASARTLRHTAPSEGHVKDAAYRVAQGLSNGANYIDENGLSGLLNDLSSAVRRTPLASLAIGVGIGFLAGLSTRSRH